MTVWVIGARGRLGLAVQQAAHGSRIITPDRAVYQNWAQAGAVDAATRYFEPMAATGGTVFVAAGLLDPAAPPEALSAVNLDLPRTIIAAATKVGLTVVTFGTVTEGRLANPYAQSKTALRDHVAAVASPDRCVLHLQLHTLYGLGAPSPFMFLGQLLHAITSGQRFRMSSGRQLREYHHVADDAAAILHLAAHAPAGVHALGHGEPVTLLSLAEAVLADFGRPDLLAAGELPEAAGETYAPVAGKSPLIQGLAFRDTLPSVAEYLRLQAKGEGTAA